MSENTEETIQKPSTRASRKQWQTVVREDVLTPLLPPPAIKAISSLDSNLHDYVGPEATVTILTSLVLAWILFASLGLLFGGTSKGRAVADDDAGIIQQSFDETVVLVGPPGGGKTRLYYRLCHDEPKMPTVSSLAANVGYCGTTDAQKLRYVDWPGHLSLSHETIAPILSNTRQPLRIVLVLDASQPVAAAATVLDQLPSNFPTIIACHKTDSPKAKNWRRIKIQLRTELERMESSRSVEDLQFLSTSSEGRMSQELLDFCQQGTLPQKE